MDFKEPLPAMIQPSIPFHSGRKPQTRAIQLVEIYHPLYPDRFCPILKLMALDNGGVDYDLIYYACCLLVENAWKRVEHCRPFLSSSRLYDPALRVVRPDNGILPAAKYFLHDPTYAGIQSPYPITPSFAHWEFPHGNIPPPWRSLSIAENPPSKLPVPTEPRAATIHRDGCCRMTEAVSGVKKTHIVPDAETPWFEVNDMGRYAAPDPSWTILSPMAPSFIHELSNLMLLRADVHRTFNSKAFTLFPKLRDNNRVLVAHVLDGDGRQLDELIGIYQNRILHQLYGVPPEYLFARFAWAILDGTSTQLLDTKRPERRIAIRVREEAADGTYNSQIVHVSSREQVPPTTSRPATSSASSPSKKRSASGSRAPRDYSAANWDTYSDSDVSIDSEFEDFSHPGARKKKRKDTNDDISVDSEFEDFSHPQKRGRSLSSRPETPPLPGLCRAL
ncbi:hypothetical protein F5Y06DRAFT_306306 [Hypoxylon sp. FL0890]|nr:hypothetical protein F5Y06DRAFT_306306 [Hypoxylon sp. FL0890]